MFRVRSASEVLKRLDRRLARKMNRTAAVPSAAAAGAAAAPAPAVASFAGQIEKDPASVEGSIVKGGKRVRSSSEGDSDTDSVGGGAVEGCLEGLTATLEDYLEPLHTLRAGARVRSLCFRPGALAHSFDGENSADGSAGGSVGEEHSREDRALLALADNSLEVHRFVTHFQVVLAKFRRLLPPPPDGARVPVKEQEQGQEQRRSKQKVLKFIGADSPARLSVIDMHGHRQVPTAGQVIDELAYS